MPLVNTSNVSFILVDVCIKYLENSMELTAWMESVLINSENVLSSEKVKFSNLDASNKTWNNSYPSVKHLIFSLSMIFLISGVSFTLSIYISYPEVHENQGLSFFAYLKENKRILDMSYFTRDAILRVIKELQCRFFSMQAQIGWAIWATVIAVDI